MAERALMFEEGDFQYQTLQGETSQLPTELQAELLEFAEASDLQVTNDLEFVAAAEVLRDHVAPHRRAVQLFFKPLKDAASRTHKMICEQEHRVLDKIVVIENTLKKRLNAYDNAKREAAEQAARKAREEAQALAEQKRLAEVQVKLDAGDEAAAEKLLAAKVVPVVSAPAIPHTAPVVKGITRQSRWVAQIVDPVAFIKWLASGTDDEIGHRMHYIEISQAELNRLAAAQRGTMQIPGVVAQEVSSVITRANRA